MLRKNFLFSIAATVALAAGSTQAQEFVRIGSGLVGSYPVFGAKLAEMINDTVPNAKASIFKGPTEQSLVKVHNGDAEMALTYTFQAKMVADGKGQLGVPAKDLRHVMTTYGSVFMAVAAKGVEINSLADIKNKPYRVWLGSKASVFWPLNMAALEAHGVSLEDIEKSGGSINTEGYGKLLAAVKDGRVDVAFFAGPTPYSLLMNLDSSKGFKFLGFSPSALNKYNEILPGTSIATIKAGSYTSDPRSVQFPYVVNQVVVSSKLNESTVYQITKMMNEKYKEMHKLFAGATDINPATALKDNKLPLHPGAAKYYKESGLIK